MPVVKKRRGSRPRTKAATIVKVESSASASEIGELRQQFGELHGLFKAHIKETDRDRTAHAEWRDETKLERQAAATDRRAMAGMIEKLSTAVTAATEKVAATDKRVGEIDDRVKDSESFISNIKIKLGVASFIVGGAVSIILYVLHQFAHEIKAIMLKPFQ